MILSHYQAKPLLAAYRAGTPSAVTSLDLGMTTVSVVLGEDGMRLPDGSVLRWGALETIARSGNACYVVSGAGVEPVKRYSQETDRLYSLMPTARAPTMLLSGTYMHRVKGTDPLADTEAKVRAAAPVSGAVLDTSTGLGYTAIAAARTADRVVTIELDPVVLEIARANPWSAELFGHPRIEQRIGDSAELIEHFPAGSFDVVIHDPPKMSLAGELFSAEFYRELHRILRPGGRLFHYVGDPTGIVAGRVGKGVLRRLRDAGFRGVTERRDAFGFGATR